MLSVLYNGIGQSLCVKTSHIIIMEDHINESRFTYALSELKGIEVIGDEYLKIFLTESKKNNDGAYVRSANIEFTLKRWKKLQEESQYIEDCLVQEPNGDQIVCDIHIGRGVFMFVKPGEKIHFACNI